MANFSVQMPGPGWGPAANAFTEAYQQAQDRTMAQGQSQALMELRALQTEAARRGLAKDTALEQLRQQLAAAPDTAIPLASERTVAQPYSPEGIATATEAAGLGVPPPAPPPPVVLPGQTMQGLTQETFRKSIADPRVAAALMTPEGQVAAKARGALTKQDLDAQRAFAEAHQESLALMPQARAAVDEGDKIKFNATMGALYQRQRDIFARTDPARAHDMGTRSDTYYAKATDLQFDKHEAALQGEDLKAMGALLAKLSAPGGATLDNVTAALAYEWKSKRGQAEDWELHRVGIEKAIGRLAQTEFQPLMQAVFAEMDAQRGRRDPQAALVSAVRKMGGPGLDLAARALADKGELGKWARQMFGGKGTTENDVVLARKMVEETQADGTPGTLPGQPGYEGKVGARLGQIRRPAEGAVTLRHTESGLRTGVNQARLSADSAARELAALEKNAPKVNIFTPGAKEQQATYETDVLAPAGTRRAEWRQAGKDAESELTDFPARQNAPQGPPPPPLPPPPAGPAVPDQLRGRGAPQGAPPGAATSPPSPDAVRMAHEAQSLAYQRHSVPFSQLTEEQKRAIYEEVSRGAP